MLETIREFGWECLTATGEDQSIRQAHARFFLALAEQAEPELWGAAEREWLDRLETEHDNFRAALGWAGESGEAEVGLRLGRALWRFWHVRGHLREGRERLETVLALPGAAARDGARARALNGAGALALDQGDCQRAAALHEESLAIAQECDDRESMAYALLSLGNVAIVQGSYEEAKALYEESLSLWRSLGNEHFVAQSLNNMGRAVLGLGQPDEAIALFEESLALKRKRGNQGDLATTLNNLGVLALDRGNYERAAMLLEESLRLSQKLGHSSWISESLNNLARLASEQGDLERAACLLAKVAALSDTIGAPLPDDYEQNRAVTRAGLGDEAFAAAWGQGQAMTLEQAIASGSAATDRV
jgi:tetratricopeptide (TPR) repeat protein